MSSGGRGIDTGATPGYRPGATLPVRVELTRQLRRSIWGIDDVMFNKVQAFVDEFNVIIGVRRRV